MKNLNITGKIKIIVIALLSVPGLIIPSAVTQLQVADLIIPLLFGCLGIPFIMRINRALIGSEVSKPSWNDNPFAMNKPLIFIQFAGYFFIATGLSMATGTAIKLNKLSGFPIASISFGIGILIGIRLTLRWRAE